MLQPDSIRSLGRYAEHSMLNNTCTNNSEDKKQNWLVNPGFYTEAFLFSRFFPYMLNIKLIEFNSILDSKITVNVNLMFNYSNQIT